MEKLPFKQNNPFLKSHNISTIDCSICNYMPLTYCIGEKGAETAWREAGETGAAVDWARVRGLPVSVANSC